METTAPAAPATVSAHVNGNGTVPETVPTERIQQLIAQQTKFFNSGQTRDVSWRLQQLRTLKKAIKAHEQEAFDALKADLGKPEFESYATEVGFMYEDIGYAVKHLRSWARPTPVATPLHQMISTAQVIKEPYGRALIVAPWNYPFQLMLSPLVGAIAAGNVALIKPSEFTPATNAVVKKILTGIFKEEFVAVVEGAVQTSAYLLEQKHDYIFFTGSVPVGRIVAQAAAKHLTPVTLELGGKSPAFVDSKLNLANTAKRLVWGKYVNCGQTCVAPDYLLVDKAIKPKLVHALKETIAKFFGDNPQDSPDYGRIIHQRHYERLKSFLGQGTVVYGGDYNDAERYLGPTLLDNVQMDSPLMQEEIFGPVLPIVEYNSLDDAIAYVNKHDKPLALYIFSNRKSFQEKILAETTSGGGCINDTLVHLGVPDLPFGGVGSSGIGMYHGKASFDAFSHHRSFLKKSNLIDLPTRYAPYRKKLSQLKLFMR